MCEVDLVRRYAVPGTNLGPRQERFVEEYLVDLTATQAAIQPCKVQRAITARMAERSKRTDVTADRALVELARLAFSDLRRLFHKDGRLKVPTEWDDNTAASVASVEVVTRSRADGEVEHVYWIKLWDKGKALEQLLSLFSSRMPGEGTMGSGAAPWCTRP
jgi:phage terminase small subunit